MDDLYFMDEALKLAKEAFDDGEVPVETFILCIFPSNESSTHM